MPVKPPTRNTVSVEVHTRPVQTDSPRLPRPDILPHLDFDTPTVTRPHHPTPAGSTPAHADLDIITPAPVTISQTPSTVIVSAPAPRPLEHYRITTTTPLPLADADGFITLKGRRYVEVTEVGVVPVGVDPHTGQHRARLSSELQPSGPVLVRDPQSKLWYELDDSPITFALSDSRLQAFRTELDFTGVEPGNDGLHRFDGKLYAVIEKVAYQALHDPEATTALTPVMRIVRADDAVAASTDNQYVATRPGRSEAIVFDPLDGWLGVNLPGAGGMHRAGQTPHRPLMERFTSALNRLNSPAARARKLYPSFSEEQVTTFIQSLGDDVPGGLVRRETDYKTLKKELTAWSRTHTQSPVPAASKAWIELAVVEIKRCWRQQTGTTLKLIPAPDGTTLPPLKADFGHVRTLELDKITWSDTADTFLSGFSGLEHLTVTRTTLEKLPDAVATLQNLKALDLSSNRIQLDAPAAANLSTLSRLERIDLSGNPLGQTPDFSAMAALKVVNLSNTRIDQWPTGLEQQTGLELVDLRQNRLSEVPETILNPPADQLQARARINGVTLLEDNAFAPGYWRTLEGFWRRVAAAHPELAPHTGSGAFRLDGDTADIVMVQRLHPDKDAQAVKDFVLEMDDAARTGLAARVQELERLETQLEEYVRSHNSSATADDSTKKSVQRIARSIKACWLRTTRHSLLFFLEGGPLPNLNADFSHVSSLTLKSIVWSDAADVFLSNFPNLEHLSITHSGIGNLPGKINEMNKLKHLDLNTNRIELDEESAATLSALSQLETVNLADNPALKLTPDFSAMSGLTSLSLSHTGISQWPTGLQDKTALTNLDLRNNRLREVPHALLDPPVEQLPLVARINAGTLLEGNAFPSAYWRKFDGFWRRLNAAHPELWDTAQPSAFDSENSRAQRYRRLFPSKSIKECREFIWGLERGTVATKLNSLEQEFGVLKTQLDAWVFSGGGNRGGYVRAFQLEANALTRSDRVKASERIIKCWRRETPQRLANDRTPIGLELDLSGLILPTLPDIDVDFSHVGSLRLSNMALSTSPEGFLTRFRHVRWLDLSQNELRELPPAVGEMSGMTRLFLQNNQISLTADTARVLSERTTLRALWLHENPRLGIPPDFSQMTDIRSVNLANTGIDTFPSGIADQPLLDTFNLSNNRITDIPDAVIAPPDDRLAHTVRINNVTDIRNNPLSAETQTRLFQYDERLLAAEMPLRGLRNLIDTARGHAPVVRPATDDPMSRWTSGLTTDEVTARRSQWRTLHEQPRAEGLFDTLERLLDIPTGHHDLQRRVWKLIDSITENNADSERLRKEVFDRAGDAACCDRAAFTFTNLEILTMVHDARSQARDHAQGPQLSALSKALFRLHEVDKIASADIAQREARILESRPQGAAAQVAPHVREEVEIRLFYRHRLKDRLQLPGQPERMGFDNLVEVSKAQLDAAYDKVIALDNSPEAFDALVSRQFWQEFVTHKYRVQFEVQQQTFQDRQATLDDAHAAGTLAFADYDAQSKALQTSLAKVEEALIVTLSRQELNEHSARHTGEEAAGGTE